MVCELAFCGACHRNGQNQRVHVAMLGPLEVRANSGCLLEVGGARLRALLILLALQPGQVVTTSRLVDGLWDEEMPAGAANALQALVSRLRRAVPEVVIAARPAGYQLMLAPDSVDVPRFERLAAIGRAQLPGDPARAAATLRDALALWRGPALADVADAGFAQVVIARLDELRLAALQDRIDADLRLGVTAPLVAELEGLVVEHPLREPLVGRLMRALQAAGRPGAALTAYDQARTRLVEQLGIEPSAGLAALHLAILRADGEGPDERRSAGKRAGQYYPDERQADEARTGTESDAAAAVAQPAARMRDHDGTAGQPGTNLRAELTSFVGRDTELMQVADLVGTHRLTTLTGPGGAGKTRLAVEAARAELGAMPDGVWLVELAPVTDPAEVAATVLATLGLQERSLMRGGRQVPAPDTSVDPLERLAATLSGKQALLVLDNCEHLVAAAAVLADRVLGACPRVRIIATSREPLNITGEVLWPVRPLAMPPLPLAGQAPDPAALTGYASVQLLVQRAQAVCPGFEVDAANAAAVARICRALDGMPLAIELAAARLRSMSPEQVAARLDDRFRLLTGGSRTALPRHQTLRAVVGWSWDLLDDAERALWRRFSVFAGGATLEAVEQVCAGGPVAADQVLDLLTALVDKSLLTVRHPPEGPRYRMLEIIRAYGRERLAEAAERDSLRAAHAGYFVELAELAQEYLLGAEQLPWLQRLSDDQDNLHTAVRGAVAAGAAATALRLVGALGWYWWLRGHKAEGAELTGEALGVAGEASSEQRAVAYAMGALLAIESQDNNAALAWFQAAADLATGIPNPENHILRLVGPFQIVFEMTETARGSVPAGVLDAAVGDPHPWLSATARIIRGQVALNFGRQHAEAEADFLAALEVYRELGERWGMGFALVSLATLAGWRGEYAAAIAHREQAVVLAAELGALEDVAQFRAQLARELWMLGERERARAAMARALRDAEGVGLPGLRAMVALLAGDLARLDGELAAARAHLIRAADLVGDQGPPQFHAVIASALGLLAGAEGDLVTARAEHAAALAAARSSPDAPVTAQVLIGLADLAILEADPARAAELLGASVAIRGTPDLTVVDYARAEAAARAALGDAGYDDAYRRGQSATMDNLADLPGPDAPPLARPGA